MVKPALIDLNPIELKYYPFMIGLNKCTASCNVLSLKLCVPKETREINVKAFNMIANKNEAKTMIEHILCDWKCKFDSTICNSNQKRNKKIFQYKCKSYRKRKRDYSWNSSECICENSKYLKSIADTSAPECDDVISVLDIVSTKKANDTSTASTNCQSIKSFEIIFIFY